MALNDYNTPLITGDDIRQFIPKFTETMDEAGNINAYIIQAQQLDVGPSIGEALMLDLCENKTADKYKTLLRGEKYTDSANKKKVFTGLAAAIAWYAHARYVLDKNVNDTPFGMEIKTNEFGTAVTEKTLQRISQQDRANADKYLLDAHKYLKEKTAVYTLYLSDECSENVTPSGSYKITKI